MDGKAYREQQQFTTSTSTKTFEAAIVKPNTILILTHLTLNNKTTANKKMHIGWKDNKGIYRWVKTVQETSTYSIHLSGHLTLLEDERPAAQIESPTASDVVQFTTSGMIYEIKE